MNIADHGIRCAGMRLLLQLSIAVALAAGGELQAANAADEVLPAPSSLTVDASLPRTEADAAVLAARRFYAFWNTGEERYLAAAIAPGFTDRTLPKGRPQGPRRPGLRLERLSRFRARLALRDPAIDRRRRSSRGAPPVHRPLHRCLRRQARLRAAGGLHRDRHPAHRRRTRRRELAHRGQPHTDAAARRRGEQLRWTCSSATGSLW